MSCLWMEDDEKNEAEIIGTAGLGIDFWVVQTQGCGLVKIINICMDNIWDWWLSIP